MLCALAESEAIIKSHGDKKGPQELMKETTKKMSEKAKSS